MKPQPTNHHRSEGQLVFFTTLTQMAVGLFIFWGLAAVIFPPPSPFSDYRYPRAALMSVMILLALGTLSAGTHLGRPSHAVFSVTNLRSSWLSREALLGGGFGLVSLFLLIRRWIGTPFSILDEFVILVGMVLGLALVFGISRLYMLRTVPAWNHIGTPLTFFITTFLLGIVAATTIWFALIFVDDAYAIEIILSRLIIISSFLILLLAALQFIVFVFVVLYLSKKGGIAAESVRLLWTDLRGLLIGRMVIGGIGVGILVVKLMIWLTPLAYFLAFGLIIVSEILGRYLFYGFYRREGI